MFGNLDPAEYKWGVCDANYHLFLVGIQQQQMLGMQNMNLPAGMLGEYRARQDYRQQEVYCFMSNFQTC